MENTREQRQKEEEEKAAMSGANERKAALDKAIDERKKINETKDKTVPEDEKPIFIGLDGGTAMLTHDGVFEGRDMPGQFKISSQKVNKITDGKVKAQYISFSLSDAVRLFQAFDENKVFIMAQVDKERARSTSLNMDRK